MNINIFASIFKVILLGFCAALACWLWYMVIHILRNWNKRIDFDWNAIQEVSVVDINWTDEDYDVTFIKKIVFGPNRIYIGFKRLGDTDSIPHACLVVPTEKVPDVIIKKFEREQSVSIDLEGKRAALSIWRRKANFNDHEITLETIETLTTKIVDDILCKVNPMYDVRLEALFMVNGWTK